MNALRARLALFASRPNLVVLLAVLLALFLQVAVGFAQEETQVVLSIPTNVIFTETNNWLQTFAPIAAIGIGITLALAVLGYIGKLIISAFR